MDQDLTMNRRDLLHAAVAVGGASLLASPSSAADDASTPPLRIIDTNVSLFQWPFRRLPLDDTEALVEKLRSLGIVQAWAGSFEGLLHRDLGGVNRRLAQACQSHPELIPIGSVNPQLPDWQDDLRRCVEEHNMPGIRLHPNYHGYALDDPSFLRLLEEATAAGCFVQLAAAMEDTRTQHPLLRVADVDLDALPDLLPRVAGVRLQILNWRPRQPLLAALAKTPSLYFDTARAEGTDGVPGLVQNLPPGRVMFGTHAPFLIPEAALIRVHEAGQLDEPALRRVFSTNAEQFAG